MGGQRISDGTASYLGGMSYGRQPGLIGDNQVWNLVNGSVRGGFVTNRPPWNKRVLDWANSDSDTRFTVGNPQGISVYQSGPKAYIVVSAGGRQFAIDPISAYSSQDISPSGALNAKNLPKAYYSQWENFFIIQDGVSPPIYLNGLTATRDEREQYAIPVGTAMAYGWGRGWVAKGNQFVAGDITGGVLPDGSQGSVINFSEQSFLAEGGAFQLPAMLGDINGMAFIPLQDTATGQGQLMVGGDYGVGTVNGGVPRDQWKSVQIQQVAMLDIGWASQDANVLLNGDIFFRAYDGIRSYRMARAQQGINGNTPQSEEVYPYVSTDAQSLLKYASGVFFDNRILITTAPQWMSTYCRWKGLVVLDSYPCGSLWGNNPPVWEGMWDGLNIVQICTGVFNKETRCFALVRNEDATVRANVTGFSGGVVTVDDPSYFVEGDTYFISGAGYFQFVTITGNSIDLQVIDASGDISVGATISRGGYNEIWELTKTGNYDTADGENIPIQSKITTKSYSFKNPWSSKKLSQFNMWVDDVHGEVTWDVKFRPDQYPCMFDFASGSLCQDDAECGEDECPNLNRQPSYKPRISRSAPSPRTCNTVTKEPAISGYEFQMEIAWTGKMRIRQIRVDAFDTTDQTRGDTSDC